MKIISKQEDLDILLSSSQAMLFIFVDWSVYAVKGRRIFVQLEMKMNERPTYPEIAFGLADISEEASTGYFISDWLTHQDSEPLRLFPNIAMGAGSILWIKNGCVIDFEFNAASVRTEELVSKTKRIFD